MTKLIAYYSRADENYVNGFMKTIEVGNTEIVAKMIQEVTGVETFKIEQQQPYAKSYQECVIQAQEDQRNNARPRLCKVPESLDGVDVIYLGYPNYWSTMPMAVFTFLEHFDFRNKIIKPFCTHEGSGLGNSVKDIKRLCPMAKVQAGLAIRGSDVQHSLEAIKQWIHEDNI